MEKKNLPHLDQVVGIPTPNTQKRQEIEATLINRFNHSRERFNEELEKTETDLLLIDFTQKAVDEILSKYGRANLVNIPHENVHIFKKGGVKEFTQDVFDGGAHSTVGGDFLVDRDDNNVNFVISVFHELVHTKVLNKAQVVKENSIDRLMEYRSGFSMTSRDGKVTYFDDVNEAIVGFLTKKFYEEYVRKSDLFKDEIKEVDEKGIHVDTTRQKELEDFLRFIDTLHERNKDIYSSDQILHIFLNAGINGSYFQVARLIEDTFGKGSFREIGRQTGYKK